MQALPASSRARSSRVSEVAHAWISRPIYDELQFQARSRLEHADRLAAKILTAVLVLGIADELIEKAERELEIS